MPRPLNQYKYFPVPWQGQVFVHSDFSIAVKRLSKRFTKRRACNPCGPYNCSCGNLASVGDDMILSHFGHGRIQKKFDTKIFQKLIGHTTAKMH